MSFYIKPPRGDISLEKLTELAVKRIQFMDLLNEYNRENDFNAKYDDFHETLSERADNLSESVMEGTTSDKVSHFILRYCVATNKDWEFRNYFLERERGVVSISVGYGSAVSYREVIYMIYMESHNDILTSLIKIP